MKEPRGVVGSGTGSLGGDRWQQPGGLGWGLGETDQQGG